MAPGVHVVDAHRADADGGQAPFQRRGVRGDVDAEGEPADDEGPGRGLGERPHDAPAAVAPVQALVAGADDGDRRPVAEQLRGRGAAAHVEQQRGVGAFPEGLRIMLVEDVQELTALGGEPLVLGLRCVQRGRRDLRRAGVVRPEQLEPLLVGEFKDRPGGAERVDQGVGEFRLVAENGVQRNGAHDGRSFVIHFS